MDNIPDPDTVMFTSIIPDSVIFFSTIINPFVPNAHFVYLLRTSENSKVF